MLLKPSNMTYTYDNSRHENDDGKVNYVAENKMPQQLAFHGVVCLHRCQVCGMLDSAPTYHKHNFLMGYHHVCNTGGSGFDSILKHFFHICWQIFSVRKNSNFSF